MATPGLTALNIRGYRPFRDFRATIGKLEVLVGANGSGKSALFEFLKFLRDSTYQDIPPEIIAGSIGQEIFHSAGPERFGCPLDAVLGRRERADDPDLRSFQPSSRILTMPPSRLTPCARSGRSAAVPTGCVQCSLVPVRDRPFVAVVLRAVVWSQALLLGTFSLTILAITSLTQS